MEMHVALPVPPADFNFDSSACSSPYMTAPSSPTRFGNYYFSAPTSPTRASTFYNHFNDLYMDTNPILSAPTIPFEWEEKPGIPKSRGSFSNDQKHHHEEDFEFDFSGQLEKTSLPADELFDGGKIRPLKLPPRLQVGSNGGVRDQGPSSSSPRSPSPRAARFSRGRKLVKEVLSPRHHKKEHRTDDRFAVAMDKTRKDEHENQEERRERERSASIRNRGSRSLSPLRVSDIMFDTQEDNEISSTTINSDKASTSAYASFLSAISFSSKGNRKWKLKDLWLFRSASEGRATTGKDHLRKYAVLSPKMKSSSVAQDVKNSSFRSTDSMGSVSSRRKGPASPHELHYTANRAVTEEMRRKTFLPYKHGLLGCLRFNTGLHEVSRGAFVSLTRGGGCR
ncbi:hypothetical protein D8674_026356 [Pyrus ussuriensis x Pyrus communis]|uniref:Uncharacterized protein n=1 Tax=Pyrus ussuriensis x Pyrus communis TaxID=2448454 RepID=A0A5N5IBE1_9ROSA|nr:hypothetical protein D8674_026356 [Pyrus ussuriensis x Pyrus communis]